MRSIPKQHMSITAHECFAEQGVPTISEVVGARIPRDWGDFTCLGIVRKQATIGGVQLGCVRRGFPPLIHSDPFEAESAQFVQHECRPFCGLIRILVAPVLCSRRPASKYPRHRYKRPDLSVRPTGEVQGGHLHLPASPLGPKPRPGTPITMPGVVEEGQDVAQRDSVRSAVLVFGATGVV